MRTNRLIATLGAAAAITAGTLPAFADSTSGLTLDSAHEPVGQIGAVTSGADSGLLASVFQAATSKPLAVVRVWESPAAAQPASVELLPAANGVPTWSAQPLATATRTSVDPAAAGGQWDVFDFSTSGLSLTSGTQYAVAWRFGNGVNLYSVGAQDNRFLGQMWLNWDSYGTAAYPYWGAPIYEIYTNPGHLPVPQSVTETVKGASLGFVSAPGAVTPPSTTLNGVDEVTPAFSLPLDIGDATGSGAGWNVSVNASRFADGAGRSLGSLYQVSEPTPTCDAATTCTAATDSTSLVNLVNPVGYGTSTLAQVADTGTGMGDQQSAPTYKLAIPANSYAGNYTSTWTVSLNSAPH